MSITLPARPPVLAELITRPTSRVRGLAIDAGLVLSGVALIAVMAKVSLFIGPIPMTGQTLGVIVVGAALGAVRGAAALLSYLLVGLAGVPVFAGPVAGPGYLLAPSFGFVIGFIPAAFVAGWFAQRAWDRRPLTAFIGFIAASAIPFVVGLPYFAMIVAVVQHEQPTLEGVLGSGFWPFVLPGIIKAAVAALLVPAAWLVVRAIDGKK